MTLILIYDDTGNAPPFLPSSQIHLQLISVRILQNAVSSLSAHCHKMEVPYLFGYKFLFSRMTTNNLISPMKFCYNTSFTLPKQSQRSRSVLWDRSSFVRLFWKKKHSCLITKEIRYIWKPDISFGRQYWQKQHRQIKTFVLDLLGDPFLEVEIFSPGDRVP